MNKEFTPIYDLLINYGLSDFWASSARSGVLIVVLFILAGILHIVGRSVFLRLVNQITKKSKTNYDDIFLENKVFQKFSFLFPAFAIYAFDEVVLAHLGPAKDLIIGATNIFVIGVTASLINAVIKSFQNIAETRSAFKNKPLTSYRQVATILNYGIAIIIIVSILIGKSPMYLFSALGALTAVLILVFRDSILGFVASIQLASNDMIRVGDWVSVESYGADGDVLEINLNTVKVKNFDNTITTVPTYAFISDSFKNWRAMQESGGRRIKRKVSVAINSIKHCDQDLLNQMLQIDYLEEYVSKKIEELDQYNKSAVKNGSTMVNGRRLTNVGLFRQYIEQYLKKHPDVNTELTCMVRQLEFTETGLPLEVYCFSKDKDWVNYEKIQADIFDHILAVAGFFDIELFQNPSGSDFKKLMSN